MWPNIATDELSNPDPMIDNTVIDQPKPEVTPQKTTTVLNVDRNNAQHIDHQPVKSHHVLNSTKQADPSTTTISTSSTLLNNDADHTIEKGLEHAIDPNVGIKPKQPLDPSTVEQPFRDKPVARPYPAVEPAIRSKQDKAQPSPLKPHKETTPQVRIGHIRVLVEDHSTTQPKQGQKASNTHRNPFGLRGL